MLSENFLRRIGGGQYNTYSPYKNNSGNPKVKERDSNIELLRIVSIFMIVFEHLIINGTTFFTAPTGYQLQISNALIGFTYIGVNCFLLITGYYGINFTWKKLFSFYLQLLYWEAICFVIYLIIGKTQISISTLSNVIFPISHSNTWFIKCYAILLLMSPLLNIGLNALNKQQYINILFLFTIINIYFGWFWKQPQFNNTGFNIQQLVYMYIIGGYIKRYFAIEKVNKWLYLSLYFILAICWGIISTIHDIIHIVPHWNGWAYSSPFVIVEAICLFCFFCSLHIQCKTINIIASGTFAVFILHMNRYLSQDIYNLTAFVVKDLNSNIILQISSIIILTIIIQIVLTLTDIPHQWLHQRIMHIAHFSDENR